jgi:hypothetical protein
MPVLTIEYRDDAERLALEQAIAFITQIRQVAQTAPDGTVLDACEKVALQQGRALLRSSLADAVQTRIADAEKKKATHAPVAAPAATPACPRGDTAATP